MKHRAGVGSVACPSLPPELPLLLGGYSCLFQFLHLGQEHSNFLLVPQERVKIKQTVLEKCLADGKKKKSPSIFRALVRGNLLLGCMSQISFSRFFFFSFMVESLFKRKRCSHLWHLEFETQVSVTFLWLFSRVHYYAP